MPFSTILFLDFTVQYISIFLNYKMYTVKIHWSEISVKVDLLIEIPDSIPIFIIVFNKLKIFDDLGYLATRKLSILLCVTWFKLLT
jgi:hypothetical protein